MATASQHMFLPQEEAEGDVGAFQRYEPATMRQAPGAAGGAAAGLGAAAAATPGAAGVAAAPGSRLWAASRAAAAAGAAGAAALSPAISAVHHHHHLQHHHLQAAAGGMMAAGAAGVPGAAGAHHQAMLLSPAAAAGAGFQGRDAALLGAGSLYGGAAGAAGASALYGGALPGASPLPPGMGMAGATAAGFPGGALGASALGAAGTLGADPYGEYAFAGQQAGGLGPSVAQLQAQRAAAGLGPAAAGLGTAGHHHLGGAAAGQLMTVYDNGTGLYDATAAMDARAAAMDARAAAMGLGGAAGQPGQLAGAGFSAAGGPVDAASFAAHRQHAAVFASPYGAAAGGAAAGLGFPGGAAGLSLQQQQQMQAQHQQELYGGMPGAQTLSPSAQYLQQQQQQLQLQQQQLFAHQQGQLAHQQHLLMVPAGAAGSGAISAFEQQQQAVFEQQQAARIEAAGMPPSEAAEAAAVAAEQQRRASMASRSSNAAAEAELSERQRQASLMAEQQQLMIQQQQQTSGMYSAADMVPGVGGGLVPMDAAGGMAGASQASLLAGGGAAGMPGAFMAERRAMIMANQQAMQLSEGASDIAGSGIASVGGGGSVAGGAGRRSSTGLDSSTHSVASRRSSAGGAGPAVAAKPKTRRVKTFPEKLLQAMTDHAVNEEAVAWLPDGKSFVIVSPDVFVETVLGPVFKQCKYASFVRKLHRWGFVRLTSGTGTDCFHHPLFQKNRKDLCAKIICAPRRDDDGSRKGAYGRLEKPPSLAGVERFIRAKAAAFAAAAVKSQQAASNAMAQDSADVSGTGSGVATSDSALDGDETARAAPPPSLPTPSSLPSGLMQPARLSMVGAAASAAGPLGTMHANPGLPPAGGHSLPMVSSDSTRLDGSGGAASSHGRMSPPAGSGATSAMVIPQVTSASSAPAPIMGTMNTIAATSASEEKIRLASGNMKHAGGNDVIKGGHGEAGLLAGTVVKREPGAEKSTASINASQVGGEKERNDGDSQGVPTETNAPSGAVEAGLSGESPSEDKAEKEATTQPNSSPKEDDVTGTDMEKIATANNATTVDNSSSKAVEKKPSLVSHMVSL